MRDEAFLQKVQKTLASLRQARTDAHELFHATNAQNDPALTGDGGDQRTIENMTFSLEITLEGAIEQLQDRALALGYKVTDIYPRY